MPLLVRSAPPQWWTTQSVFDPAQQTDDYAACNTGQLKSIAKKAMLEMDAQLVNCGGAGTAIHDLVASFTAVTSDRNDFAGINIGQLKAVARPFYDRMTALGYVLPYPWNNTDPNRNDFAAANIGQVKNVFSFVVHCPDTDDTDGDGLPDVWEFQHFGSAMSAQTGGMDYDDDHVTNLVEFQHSTNPASKLDTDGDTMSNDYEATYGLRPNDLGDALEDLDRDGVPNVYEYAKRSDSSLAISLPTPDYYVNPLTGGASSTDNIYITLKQALNAAPSSNGGAPAYSIIGVAAGTYVDEEGLTINKRVLITGPAAGNIPVIGETTDFQPIILTAQHIVLQNLQITMSPWFTFLGGDVAFLRVGVYVQLPSSSSSARLVNCMLPCGVFDVSQTFVRAGVWIESGDVTLAHCSIYALEHNSLIRGVFIKPGGHATLYNSLIWLASGHSNMDLAYDPSPGDPVDLAVTTDPAILSHLSKVNSLITSTFGSNSKIPMVDRYGHLRDIQADFSYIPPLAMLAGAAGPYPALDVDGENRVVSSPQKPHVGADQLKQTNGMPDWWQMKFFGNLLQASSADYDSDGLTNQEEYKMGFDPTDADTDSDGTSDIVQAASVRTDLWYPTAWLLDSDGDGLDGITERLLGTNPNNADTNSDGISDGLAVAMGLGPLNSDVDGDGLTNTQELVLGTNPYSTDTDHDGYDDLVDAFPLDALKHSMPGSSGSDHTAPSITLIRPSGAVVVP